MESIKLYTELAERARAEGGEPKVSYEVFNSFATTKGGYEDAKEYGYIPSDMTWEQYQDTYLEETPSPNVVSKSLQKTEEADEKRAEWTRKREMLRSLEPKLGETNWETTFSVNEDERGNVDMKTEIKPNERGEKLMDMSANAGKEAKEQKLDIEDTLANARVYSSDNGIENMNNATATAIDYFADQLERKSQNVQNKKDYGEVFGALMNFGGGFVENVTNAVPVAGDAYNAVKSSETIYALNNLADKVQKDEPLTPEEQALYNVFVAYQNNIGRLEEEGGWGDSMGEGVATSLGLMGGMALSGASKAATAGSRVALKGAIRLLGDNIAKKGIVRKIAKGTGAMAGAGIRDSYRAGLPRIVDSYADNLINNEMKESGGDLRKWEVTGGDYAAQLAKAVGQNIVESGSEFALGNSVDALTKKLGEKIGLDKAGKVISRLMSKETIDRAKKMLAKTGVSGISEEIAEELLAGTINAQIDAMDDQTTWTEAMSDVWSPEALLQTAVGTALGVGAARGAAYGSGALMNRLQRKEGYTSTVLFERDGQIIERKVHHKEPIKFDENGRVVLSELSSFDGDDGHRHSVKQLEDEGFVAVGVNPSQEESSGMTNAVGQDEQIEQSEQENGSVQEEGVVGQGEEYDGESDKSPDRVTADNAKEQVEESTEKGDEINLKEAIDNIQNEYAELVERERKINEDKKNIESQQKKGEQAWHSERLSAKDKELEEITNAKGQLEERAKGMGITLGIQDQTDPQEPVVSQMEQDIADAEEFIAMGDNDYVADNISHAQKRVEKANKAKPKSGEKAKRLAELQAINEEKAQAQAELDRWKKVQEEMERRANTQTQVVEQEASDNLTDNVKTDSGKGQVGESTEKVVGEDQSSLSNNKKEGSVIGHTPKDVTTSSAERQGLDYEQSNKAETATKGSGITPQSTSSLGEDSKNSEETTEGDIKEPTYTEETLENGDNEIEEQFVEMDNEIEQEAGRMKEQAEQEAKELEDAIDKAADTTSREKMESEERSFIISSIEEKFNLSSKRLSNLDKLLRLVYGGTKDSFMGESYGSLFDYENDYPNEKIHAILEKLERVDLKNKQKLKELFPGEKNIEKKLYEELMDYVISSRSNVVSYEQYREQEIERATKDKQREKEKGKGNDIEEEKVEKGFDNARCVQSRKEMKDVVYGQHGIVSRVKEKDKDKNSLTEEDWNKSSELIEGWYVVEDQQSNDNKTKYLFVRGSEVDSWREKGDRYVVSPLAIGRTNNNEYVICTIVDGELRSLYKNGKGLVYIPIREDMRKNLYGKRKRVLDKDKWLESIFPIVSTTNMETYGVEGMTSRTSTFRCSYKDIILAIQHGQKIIGEVTIGSKTMTGEYTIQGLVELFSTKKDGLKKLNHIIKQYNDKFGETISEYELTKSGVVRAKKAKGSKDNVAEIEDIDDMPTSIEEELRREFGDDFVDMSDSFWSIEETARGKKILSRMTRVEKVNYAIRKMFLYKIKAALGSDYAESDRAFFSRIEARQAMRNQYVTNKIVTHLQKKGVEIIKVTEEEIVAKLQEQNVGGSVDIKTYKDLAGRVYGWTEGGKIYLSERGFNPDTPVHEYTHIWVDSIIQKIRQGDKECERQWTQIVSVLKNTPLWDKVRNDKNYKNILKNDNDIASEVLSRYSGNVNGFSIYRYETDMLYRVKTVLKNFWNFVRSKIFGITQGDNIDTIEDIGSVVLRDFLMSTKIVEGGKDVKYSTKVADQEVERELAEIKAKAIADGTFMKAPNGKPSNLGERQWLHVRLKSFKKWFGDWEKAARIEKLRKSKPVEMNGEEYIGKYELNRESAQSYILNNLRGNYVIADTNEQVELVKKGAKKVTSHSMGNDVHVKSIALIPKIIQSSIFVEEMPSEKDDSQYDSYRYYVCGLDYNGESYTVKVTIGVKGGDYYYDHSLTEVEKGKLLDMIESNQAVNRKGFTPTGDAPIPSYALSRVKDTKLLSILQTNSSKIVDENGEPMEVWHGSPNDFNVFDNEKALRGFYFAPPKRRDSVAGYYGEGKERAFFLNIKNPIEVTPNEKPKDNKLPENKDGWVVRADKEWNRKYYNYRTKELEEETVEKGDVIEIITFEPTQIKSSTDNVGTYDSTNPDIRFSIEKAGRVMHSVDVTEEMGESVMEGQVMFSIEDLENDENNGTFVPENERIIEEDMLETLVSESGRGTYCTIENGKIVIDRFAKDKGMAKLNDFGIVWIHLLKKKHRDLYDKAIAYLMSEDLDTDEVKKSFQSCRRYYIEKCGVSEIHAEKLAFGDILTVYFHRLLVEKDNPDLSWLNKIGDIATDTLGINVEGIGGAEVLAYAMKDFVSSYPIKIGKSIGSECYNEIALQYRMEKTKSKINKIKEKIKELESKKKEGDAQSIESEIKKLEQEISDLIRSANSLVKKSLPYGLRDKVNRVESIFRKFWFDSGDSHRPLFHLSKAINKYRELQHLSPIPFEDSPYWRVDAIKGRETNLVEKFWGEYISPLKQETLKLIDIGAKLFPEVSKKDLYTLIGIYTIAKSTKERIEYNKGKDDESKLKIRNEDGEEYKDPDSEVSRILSDVLENGEVVNDHAAMVVWFEKKFPVDKLWDIIYKLNHAQHNVGLEKGLYDEQMYKFMEGFKYYVPNRGFLDSDDESGEEAIFYFSTGNRKLSSLQTTKGGKSMGDNPLTRMAFIGVDVVKRGVHNEFRRDLLDYLMSNREFGENSGLYQIVEGEGEDTKNRPKTKVWVNGKTYTILWKKGEVGNMLQKAAQNEYKRINNKWLNKIRGIISNVATNLNPYFWTKNIFREVVQRAETGIANSIGEGALYKSLVMNLKALGDSSPNVIYARKYLSGEMTWEEMNEVMPYFSLFMEYGGNAGVSTNEDVMTDLEALKRSFVPGRFDKAKKTIQKVERHFAPDEEFLELMPPLKTFVNLPSNLYKTLLHAQSTFDLCNRYQAFVKEYNQSKDPEKAATASRNSGVNYSRAGYGGSIFGVAFSLIPFSSATINGIRYGFSRWNRFTKLGKELDKDQYEKKIIASIALSTLFVAIGLANALSYGGDDEESELLAMQEDELNIRYKSYLESKTHLESIKLYTELAERARAEGGEPKVSYEVFNSFATTKGGYEDAKEYGYIPSDMTWEQYQDTYLEERYAEDTMTKEDYAKDYAKKLADGINKDREEVREIRLLSTPEYVLNRDMISYKPNDGHYAIIKTLIDVPEVNRFDVALGYNIGKYMLGYMSEKEFAGRNTAAFLDSYLPVIAPINYAMDATIHSLTEDLYTKEDFFRDVDKALFSAGGVISIAASPFVGKDYFGRLIYNKKGVEESSSREYIGSKVSNYLFYDKGMDISPSAISVVKYLPYANVLYPAANFILGTHFEYRHGEDLNTLKQLESLIYQTRQINARIEKGATFLGNSINRDTEAGKAWQKEWEDEWRERTGYRPIEYKLLKNRRKKLNRAKEELWLEDEYVSKDHSASSPSSGIKHLRKFIEKQSGIKERKERREREVSEDYEE